MAQCEFCDIAAGERPAHVLRETDHAVAFLDENPAVDGHALVAPRPHVEEVLTADEAVVVDVFRTVQTVANALSRILEPDGMSVFYTSGGLVGRVTHAHVHLLPRYADDEIAVSLSRRSLSSTAAERLVDQVEAELS